MRSATGVQQREPFVLHMIVDSVFGREGASHSSSSLTSVPRDDAGEKHSLNSICLIPHSGPCSCGERDCALERHRVVGVPPLADQRGLLDAGVQSSTSMRGVACVLFWRWGWRLLTSLGGVGVVPAPLGRCRCLSVGGRGVAAFYLPCLFRGPQGGFLQVGDIFQLVVVGRFRATCRCYQSL